MPTLMQHDIIDAFHIALINQIIVLLKACSEALCAQDAGLLFCINSSDFELHGEVCPRRLQSCQ